MDVISAAKNLAQRAKLKGLLGKVVSSSDMTELGRDLGLTLPNWFFELFTTVPLCGLELGWQAYERKPDFDGVAWMEWSDADGIRVESLECHPGFAILKRGYVNVASCSMGCGDPYFICLTDGDDPPIYQIYHDMSDEAELLLENRRIVAPNLSTFFCNALVRITLGSHTAPLR